MLAVPPLVERAEALAARVGFERSCSRETGRLLHALAAQRGRDRVGEIGTGCGVGTAWLVSALAPEVPVVTVELDAGRAGAAAALFADDPRVHVVHGNWREVMPAAAPFDLLFYDGGGKQRPDLDGAGVLALLVPGGTVVLDDFTPGRPADGDPVRRFWLEHPDLASVEVVLGPDMAAVVAVRAR